MQRMGLVCQIMSFKLGVSNQKVSHLLCSSAPTKLGHGIVGDGHRCPVPQ